MGKLSNEAEKPNFSHFSHDHPLELTAFCEADHTMCSGCKIEIVPGRNYYTCRACNYSLHHACYNMPRSLQHPADPNHDLDLLLLPSFQCKACGFHGSGFSYSCSICHVHYHTLCTQLPPTKVNSMHPHTLELEFSPPYGNPKVFRCDICGSPGSDHWLYRCSGCEFDVHLSCAGSAAPKQPPQPQNQSPLVSASQAPIPSAYNNVKAIAPQTNQCATYGNQNQIMQPNGSYMNQHQVQNPMNNSYMMSSATSGTPIGPSGTYANPSNVMQPGGAYVNQTGNYGFNQGGYVQPGGMGMGMGMVPLRNQGMGYPTQPGLGVGGAQGALGAGMAGLVVAGVVTGMGEAVGQGIVHGVAGGFGNDGPGY